MQCPFTTYNEKYFYDQWDPILEGKGVIVAMDKKSVKDMLENYRGIYDADFVCKSDDEELPFCDYEDDTLWKFVYYDPIISNKLLEKWGIK